MELIIILRGVWKLKKYHLSENATPCKFLMSLTLKVEIYDCKISLFQLIIEKTKIQTRPTRKVFRERKNSVGFITSSTKEAEISICALN